MIIGVAAILRTSGRLIFELQKRSKWIRNGSGTLQIGLGCIGGRLEPKESPLMALYREALEEIGCQVHLDLPTTPCPFLVHPDYTIEQLHHVTEEWPAIFYWQGNQPSDLPGVSVAVFSGRVEGEIQLGDLPGVLCMDRAILSKLNQQQLSIGEVLQSGGILIEQEEMPREALLMPVATVKVLLELQRHAPKYFAQCVWR